MVAVRCISLLALVASASAFVAPVGPVLTTSTSKICSSSSSLAMSAAPVDAAHSPTVVSRRDALKNAAFLFGFTGAAILASPDHAFAEDSAVDYAKVRKAIDDMVKKEPDRGPTLVRLSWHSSGTYDKKAQDGGSFKGTIRFKEELSHGANAGLDIAVNWMEPIKKANPGMSYADLYTLAGVQAIETMGGPKIKWRAGRKDGEVAEVTPDGRLPDADRGTPQKTLGGLREVFYRMGFNDQEIVALSGAHALGRCHKTASGYDGPWTPTPTTFNNAYFTLLANIPWKPKKWDGPFQYEDSSGTLMMLPSDYYLLQDESFMKYVKLYGKDSKKFYEDFSKAFTKLQELGCKGLHEV